MQQLLANPNLSFYHEGVLINTGEAKGPLLAWLTEQYDRAERKETWSILMEVAIVVFVAAELIFSIANFLRGH